MINQNSNEYGNKFDIIISLHDCNKMLSKEQYKELRQYIVDKYDLYNKYIDPVLSVDKK